MTIKYDPANKLVEDLTISPRQVIDPDHVQRLNDALAAGETLPPIIACARTKRVIDGLHRRRAQMAFRGIDVEIAVEYRTYADDAEAFVDAVRLNSAHGKSIPISDVDFIVSRARAFGISDLKVARAMRLTVARLTHLSVKRESVLSVPKRVPPPAAAEPEGDIADDTADVVEENVEQVIIKHADGLLLHLRQGQIPKSSTIETMLAEIAHRLRDFVERDAKDQTRLQIAKVLLQQGGLPLNRLAKRAGVPEDQAEASLMHEWFKKAVNGYYLTTAGRQALGD